ncbi:short-chain dehydrogenase/reductase [Mesorhizobium sp. L-8-10]|uniref:SDR family oxidoreductase n=1 Tax=Mesorhizobium sp. L-8-10 TaxID=2744523 RepID=UPI001927DFD7|nr:SDR family oxidoreductase [Mesorhizobium sp. L-8-10]BCH30479.1 short-chain dehydrogenase/reductase [Mesorhizobium sp. L-8-10]
MAELRTIIVTGASSGIGAYCARALKAEGWRVFATARRAEDIAALEADGIEAFYLDYSEPASIEALVDMVLARTGGTLDALYNNGAHAQPGAVEDLPVAALRDQFEVNLFGWHDLTRRIVPVMRRQGHGRIVNCSSILGLTPVRFRGAYAASKHALEGLSLCLRSELEGSGIHVSLIEPGPIESRIAPNGLAWFEKYVDHEASVHREAYQVQLRRLRGGGSKSRLKLKPDAVHAALRHALLSPRPKPHYLVTVPAKVGAVLKRILPARLFYRILARQA